MGMAEVTLTHKQLKTHGGVTSTVATDNLVLKHQTIRTSEATMLIKYLLYWHNMQQFYPKYLPVDYYKKWNYTLKQKDLVVQG